MRNISFSLTTAQIRNRTKTVTRRLGWRFLKPGDVLCACEKCQGLKKGETVHRLAIVRVLSVRRERLDAITPGDCVKEGVPDLCPAEFVVMFCRAMRCRRSVDVTRIEWEYVDCNRCGRPFTEEEMASPHSPPDWPGEMICDECYREYEFPCCLCGEYEDDGIADTFVAVTEAYDKELPPGIYRILGNPFYPTPPLGCETLFNRNLERVADLPGHTDTQGFAIGRLCLSCQREFAAGLAGSKDR